MDKSFDLLDSLAGTLGALKNVADKFPAIAEDIDFMLAERYIETAIDAVLEDGQKMMTPEEVREFNENLKDLRNGGT